MYGTAEGSRFPFCTIDQNVGTTPVPDPNLQILAEILHPTEVLPSSIHFVDIAGPSPSNPPPASIEDGVAHPDDSPTAAPWINRQAGLRASCLELVVDSCTGFQASQCHPLRDVPVCFSPAVTSRAGPRTSWTQGVRHLHEGGSQRVGKLDSLRHPT